MDINVILSILCFLVGGIVAVSWYKSHIVLSVINKGQYFLQTKDSCFIVMEALPEGLLPENEYNEEENVNE